MVSIAQKTDATIKSSIKIFLSSLLNLHKIEFAPPRQFVLPRIIEQDAVAFDLRFEIVRLGQRMIELVDSVVDELGVRMKRSVFILEKAVFDLRVERILNRADLLAGQNEQVVIAHVVGRCAELDALVVVDVAVLRIAAEQDHHLDLFDLLADQGDELLQIPSLVGR